MKMEDTTGCSNNSTLKRKHKPASSLVPEKLKSDRLQDFIHSVEVLCHKFQSGGNTQGHFTPDRIIKILVRGMGSSKTQVQKNYFVALVSLMNLFRTPDFSVEKIMDISESELHITGNISKGEEGEVLTGRVLVFGCLVRSGALAAAPTEVQVKAVARLMHDIKAKSYLPLVADPFLAEYLRSVEESVFAEAVWPVLRESVAPGPSQSLLVYHLLLLCEERFPSVVTTKFLKQTLTVPRVLSVTTVPALLTALKANFRWKSIDHPIYSDIFKYLCNSEEKILQTFWEEVESQLLLDTAASNKQIIGVKFFSLLVLQLQNPSQVLPLLTPKLLNWFMKKQKGSHLQNALNISCREALDNLLKLSSKCETPKNLVSIIKKLLFDPGNIMFDQLSGGKVVQLMMSRLSEKGVKKLAAKLREVVLGSSSAVELKDSQPTTRPWHNKERLQASHLFCKLLSLPAVRGNLEWRLEQLSFLFHMGFFTTSNVSVDLASLIRDSFYGSLNHKLPSLAELRSVLAGLVQHINNRLDSGDTLRVKVPPEVMPAWRKMVLTTSQIGETKKHKKEQWVPLVFQTMFYHIGLHLFKEAAFATDVLEELHSVYERVGSAASSEEEPHWTEVVMEMFLSLLSRNSQLHRHLIGCVFVHFCPIMIPQNIHQILQVLDPKSEDNPLLNTLDEDTDSSSDEDEVEVAEEEGNEDEMEESSDDGMTDFEEEEEEEDEKVNDKLRRAVIDALGDNGAMTDVESVDLEDMDETEAKRVDEALSQAFKALKPSRKSKQSSQAKALTHFRIRVLDLVEMWLNSEPPLDLMVDTLLKLLSLLEHCLVDRHQSPLETRLRAVIKKLTSTKKYNVSDCKDLHLGVILKSLLDKGDRTTTVYMSVSKELTAATLFITRASQLLPESSATTDTVLSVLKDIVRSFFMQRDCLLTVALFQQLFMLNVPLISSLAAKLPDYVFDPNVHPFRRSKALEFLILFWKNNRIVFNPDEKSQHLLKKVAKGLYKGCLKMMDEPLGKIQPKYVLFMKQAFDIIKQRQWLAEVDWLPFFKSLASFQKSQVEKPDSKKKKKKNSNASSMEVDKDSDENSTSENELHENIENEQNDRQESDEESKTENEEENEDVEENLEEETEVASDEEGSSSESEEPPKKKKKKKSEKKKNRDKIKQTQLLKNKSKQLRMEAMNVGLEENVFSKYKVLLNSKSVSPER